MTVPSEINRAGPYIGNGMTTVFPYPFRVLSGRHLKVVRTINEVEETLIFGTDYAVTGAGQNSGGSIETVVPLAVGASLTILRAVPFTQETDLENQGAYYAETVEEALDLSVMRDQELAEGLGRAVKVPASFEDPEGFAEQLSLGLARLANSADNIDAVAENLGPLSVVADNISDVARTGQNIDAVKNFSGSVLGLDDKSFSATAGQKVFTLDARAYASENVLVWVDGVRQVPGVDYTASAMTMTLTEGATAGAAVDTLVITAVSTQEVSNMRNEAVAARDEVRLAAMFEQYEFAYIVGVSEYSVKMDGITVPVRRGSCQVHLIGSGPLIYGTDWVATEGGAIKLLNAYDAGAMFVALFMPRYSDSQTQAIIADVVNAADRAETSALVAAQYDGPRFITVRQFLLSTFTYSDWANVTSVRVDLDSFVYRVAPQDAEDHHVANAGGVKFYIETKDWEIHLAAFGKDPVYASDFSDEFEKATAFAYSLGQSIISTGVRNKLPTIVLPAGIVRFTRAGALSNNIPTRTDGLRYRGAGIFATNLVYDNWVTPVETSHALVSSNISTVIFDDMTVRVLNNKRFIKWLNGGGGGGAWLYHNRVNIRCATDNQSGFDRYVDVAGTSLGSEILFTDCRTLVGLDGTFFYVNETNPQAVNMNFVNCSAGSFGGGTIFRFRAGGNLRWTGGYSSFGNGSKFLVIDPPSAGLVGRNNWDFVINGWHPETISGATEVTILDMPSEGFVRFTGCNFNAVNNSGAVSAFNVGHGTRQAGSTLNFDGCTVPSSCKMALAGATVVAFDSCDQPNIAEMLTTATRQNSNNYYSPQISIRNSLRRGVPDQDYMALERDQGAAFRQPVQDPLQTSVKVLPLKYGSTGQSGGLIVGQADTYASFSGVLPMGAIIKSVEIIMVGATTSPTVERTFKVTNLDGSRIYIPEFTWNPSLGRSFQYSQPLHHAAYTENDLTIVISGKKTGGSSSTNVGDYGYALVHYI